MHYLIYLQTPLHLTARGSHVESFQLLLEYGARIDVKDANRETPMQLAGQKKEFKYAIARYQIPTRTNEEKAVVEGKLLSITVTACTCIAGKFGKQKIVKWLTFGTGKV